MDRKALLLVLLAGALAHGDEDRWAAAVRAAPEFRAAARVEGRWDTWVYMPWRYRWTIGTGDAGGRFCRDYGINGGFLDHGRGPLAWLEKWGLRFYNDHTAGKGILYLRGANNRATFKGLENDARAVRPVPLDAASLREAKARIAKNLGPIAKSPMRLAYALDDEISWGAFVLPLPWRVNADDAAYARWLEGRGAGPPRFVTPDFTRAQLDRPLGELDFAPLLDRLTYNDSVFAGFVRELVRHANGIDPATPCGFVGGQAPSPWGGYDYAMLARQAQFIEAYDLGSAPEIIRSLAPHAVRVSTHFHKDVKGRDQWFAWSRFAHGERGLVGWVEGWFDGAAPRPWLKEFAPVLRELGGVQGPKMNGARWVHDGIALYYSHPSVQVSWVLDCEPHGKTWPKRGRDHLRGTSHLVRKAWESILNDGGLQYDFLGYDEVVRTGVPDRYRVLVLPACFALSDAEAAAIRAFAARGGRVVADFMCGLFDQHGRGRTRGALDDLFGIEHDGKETAADFFADRLWVETDQDRGFTAPRWRALFESLPPRALHHGFAAVERGLPAPGRGSDAVYLNLSPQRYLMLREEGRVTADQRAVFLDPLGVRPAVRATGDRNLEVTRFRRGDRTLLFVVKNPVLRADGSRKIERGEADIRLEFDAPVRDLVDERTRRKHGDGRLFRFELDRTEAVFVSYRR